MPGASTLAVEFGGPSDLFESIVAEFRSHDIPIELGEAARVHLIEADDSILVVFDHSLTNELFGDHAFARNKKLVRTCENQVCEHVTSAAIASAARRLLLVCDVRHASATELARAIRWVRNLALRIRYECSVNGLDNVTATYAAVVDDAQLLRTAGSVVHWHRNVLGALTDRRQASLRRVNPVVCEDLR